MLLLLGLFRRVRLFGKGHQAVVLENLALRRQLSVYKRKQASALGRARSVVLDRVVRGVEGVATSLVHRSSRHGGALAAQTIPAVLGAAFKQIGKNRAACRQFSDSHVDSRFGRKPIACGVRLAFMAN